MRLPGTENFVPAFSQLCLALALIASPICARAAEADDYQAGLAAYRAGDVAGAMAPLKRAADSGHAPAQALYGSLLDSADFDEEAAGYLRKAAEQGDAEGQYGLAKMYFTQEAKALADGDLNRLMRAAAAQGHEQAIISVALGYISRDPRLAATNPNDPEAAQYLLKAGELGDRTVIAELVRAYRTGQYGLGIDAAKAEEWSQRLANLVSPKRGAKK